MVERYEVVNHFTTKFKNCRYLEIGSLRRECFQKINAEVKEDVEPFPQGFVPTYEMTSDRFFENHKYVFENNTIKFRKYDVIYIDGLHLCEQVIADVKNASEYLNPNGYIILHDCYPKEEGEQEREPVVLNWMGDVWKAQAWLVKNFKNVYTIEDSDCGCGVIEGPVFYTTQVDLRMTWHDLQKDVKNILNLRKWEEVRGK